MVEKNISSASRAKVLLDTARLVIEKHEAMARSQGLMFNLFELLDRQHDEIKGHSAFIAELLNPHGRHGQSDTFLQLFVYALLDRLSKEAIGEPTGKTKDWSQVEEKLRVILSGDLAKKLQVFVEKAFLLPSKGLRDETLDGRVDILCIADDFAMVIENKVWAVDQESQLFRYQEFLNNAHKDKIHLLAYLTPNGDEPSEYSLRDTSNGSKNCLPKEEVLLLDYQTFILDWIDRCISRIPMVAQVREGLHQYWQVIRRITGQGWSLQMTKELSELLRKDNNLEVAQKLSESVIDVKVQLEIDFWSTLEKKVLGIWRKEDVVLKADESDIRKSGSIRISQQQMRRFST